jgi:hypothetical protein
LGAPQCHAISKFDYNKDIVYMYERFYSQR